MQVKLNQENLIAMLSDEYDGIQMTLDRHYVDKFHLLIEVCKMGQNDILDYVIDAELGMLINGEYFDYDEIKEVISQNYIV